MPVNKDDAVLLLPKNKKVIVLYSKNSNAIIEAWQLHITGTGGNPSKNCPVTIWVENNEVKLNFWNAALPNQTIIDSKLLPNIWLNSSSIIIGTGDLRDLTFKIGSLDLSNLTPGDFVVKFVNDYTIEIYSSKSITMNAIAIKPNIC